MVQAVSGIHVLQNLGAPHSQYGNLICEGGPLAEASAGELVDYIRSNPECDVAVFHPVPECSMLGRFLHSQPSLRGHEDSSVQLDLTAFANSEAYRRSEERRVGKECVS